MLTSSISLAKLAVSTNLLCFLMVTIVIEYVHAVSLYNDCGCQNIAVDLSGRVFARSDLSQTFENLTIKSTDFSGKLSMYGLESGRYLCFNHKWKLVGYKRERGDPRCLFYEEMAKNGYTRYRSAADQARYLGFHKKTATFKGFKERKLTPKHRKCLNFLKIDARRPQPVRDHNELMAKAPTTHHHHPSFPLGHLTNKDPNGSSRISPIPHDMVRKGRSDGGTGLKIRHRNHHRPATLTEDVT